MTSLTANVVPVSGPSAVPATSTRGGPMNACTESTGIDRIEAGFTVWARWRVVRRPPGCQHDVLQRGNSLGFLATPQHPVEESRHHLVGALWLSTNVGHYLRGHRVRRFPDYRG